MASYGIRELIYLMIFVVIGFVILYIVVGVGDQIMQSFTGSTDAPLYTSYTQDTQGILNNVGLIKILVTVVIATAVIGILLRTFVFTSE